MATQSIDIDSASWTLLVSDGTDFLIQPGSFVDVHIAFTASAAGAPAIDAPYHTLAKKEKLTRPVGGDVYGKTESIDATVIVTTP